jgi:hypothetical protein
MKLLMLIGLFALVTLNAALMEPCWLWYAFLTQWRGRTCR